MGQTAKNIGVLRDIKSGEYRVVMTPDEVRELVSEGTEVLVASGAGEKAAALPAARAI